jgi:hypothetical protein
LTNPYSPDGVEGAFSELSCKRFSEVRQESFKDHPFGVAPLLAMLLHWVQPLPTGAWAQEYKRMHLLQIEHRIRIEQAAKTVMEE